MNEFLEMKILYRVIFINYIEEKVLTLTIHRHNNRQIQVCVWFHLLKDLNLIYVCVQFWNYLAFLGK